MEMKQGVCLFCMCAAREVSRGHCGVQESQVAATGGQKLLKLKLYGVQFTGIQIERI